ncbi:MAG: hypothetical protein M0R80_02870 [Proteobacteria bacterium]|nr:hypothetical protein [Pseudomonadota bacterium]
MRKSENMVKFEDVKGQTTEEYFNGNEFSIDAFNKKYTIQKGETYVQAVKRVCDYIASVEATKELREYWSERWFDEIYNDWWHPAGSIMQGAASGRKISLANCTTLSLGAGLPEEEWDNLESIIRNAGFTIAKTAAYRQGLGLEFSRLRPVGTKVMNSANESSGAIHWMKFLDSIGYYVGQQGRIPAMLFSLACDHPDIEDFIKVKSDHTKIQNANISVQCSDAFYAAVRKDADWRLSFNIPEVKKGDRIYLDSQSKCMDAHFDKEKKKWYTTALRDRKGETIERTVKARKLLELIAQNMHTHAEPGIQNIDVARKYSNSDYVYNPEDEYDSRIVSTNACSEQYLSRESLCVLASLNAGKFSIHDDNCKKELAKIAYSMNRFLDNVNEAELRNGTYATPHQKLAIEKLRRTGAGFTNMCAWLFKQNLEYGTEDGNKAVANFMKWYNFYLYESSIALGKEKGSFELFDEEKYCQSPFIKRLMKLGLKFKTMRNSTLTSIAPTGTLTTQFRDNAMSYGIEPSTYLYWWKRTRMNGQYEFYFCVPSVVREFFAQKGCPLPMDKDTIKDTWDGKIGKPIAEFIEAHKNEIGIKFRCATEIHPNEKLDLMAQVMTWVDSSISVTYLLPEGSDWKTVYDFILLAHEKEVKSIAAFPDKKMYGIISIIPFKDLAKKLISEGVVIHEQNFCKEELEELYGTTYLSPNEYQIQKTKAPIRPQRLPCDIHHTKVTKKLDKIRTFDYIVLVGIMPPNDPYEIFVAENGILDKKYKRGVLIKKARGVYALEIEGKIVIENIAKDATESEDVLTRMVSTSLRHGADIHFIVQQLEKSQGDLFAFSKAIYRILKKYVPDNTKITGMTCPSCGCNEFIRIEGCATCVKCGHSKCS